MATSTSPTTITINSLVILSKVSIELFAQQQRKRLYSIHTMRIGEEVEVAMTRVVNTNFSSVFSH